MFDPDDPVHSKSQTFHAEEKDLRKSQSRTTKSGSAVKVFIVSSKLEVITFSSV